MTWDSIAKHTRLHNIGTVSSEREPASLWTKTWPLQLLSFFLGTYQARTAHFFCFMGQNCWASPNLVVLPWKPVDSWTRLRKAPLYHLDHGLRGRLEKVPPYSRWELWQCRELCSWGTRSTAALWDCQGSTSPAVAFTRAGMSPALILGGFSTSLHALGMAIAAGLWVDVMDSRFCFMHMPHYLINYEGNKSALISGRYSLYTLQILCKHRAEKQSQDF